MLAALALLIALHLVRTATVLILIAPLTVCTAVLLDQLLAEKAAGSVSPFYLRHSVLAAVSGFLLVLSGTLAYFGAGILSLAEVSWRQPAHQQELRDQALTLLLVAGASFVASLVAVSFYVRRLRRSTEQSGAPRG